MWEHFGNFASKSLTNCWSRFFDFNKKFDSHFFGTLAYPPALLTSACRLETKVFFSAFNLGWRGIFPNPSQHESLLPGKAENVNFESSIRCVPETFFSQSLFSYDSSLLPSFLSHTFLLRNNSACRRGKQTKKIYCLSGEGHLKSLTFLYFTQPPVVMITNTSSRTWTNIKNITM